MLRDSMCEMNRSAIACRSCSSRLILCLPTSTITLGVMGGYMHRTSCTRCLNLLLTYPEGCRANCAYCGLARHREADRN